MGLRPRDEMTRPRANSLVDPASIKFHLEKDVKEKLRKLAEISDRSLDKYMRVLATAHVEAQSKRGVV